MPGKSQTLSQANEYTAGAERVGAGKTGPTHAEVQYYMDVARRLRSEAFASMIRKAYAKLFQCGTTEDAASHDRAHSSTPHHA